MTPRQCFHAILGEPRAEQALATMGTEWTALLAIGTAKRRGMLESEPYRQMMAWLATRDWCVIRQIAPDELLEEAA